MRKALVICDDARISQTCTRLLSQIEFEAVFAASDMEAIQRLREDMFPFAVIQWKVKGFLELLELPECPPFILIGSPLDCVMPHHRARMVHVIPRCGCHIREFAAILRRHLPDDSIRILENPANP